MGTSSSAKEEVKHHESITLGTPAVDRRCGCRLEARRGCDVLHCPYRQEEKLWKMNAEHGSMICNAWLALVPNSSIMLRLELGTGSGIATVRSHLAPHELQLLERAENTMLGEGPASSTRPEAAANGRGES